MHTINKVLLMKTIKIVITFLALALMSGCSMKYPLSADEFRQMLPGSTFGEVEKVTINRSLSKIAKTYKKKAKACLSKTIKSESCMNHGYGMQCTTMITHYKPTLKISSKHIELHMQQDSPNMLPLGEIPKDGLYTLVADITPVSKNKSKLVIYSGSFGSDTIKKALKGWATGKNKGCPDLTKG